MPELRKMNAGEFARRLRADSEMPDKRFAFFIGAGCSISSGIPSAGSLVKDHWFPKLQEVCSPNPDKFKVWLKKELPNHENNHPAASYGAVIERLFLNPEDRQREIERLCDGKFPGFGYAVLATLIDRFGGTFNVVITTNFEDLVSDELYLFTQARPLVIGHKSLAGFIRPTRTRPVVVKIHGDAHLSPQNTIAETANLQKEVERQVKVLLHDRVPIFMGYGGNDIGISKMLTDLPKEALPFGVYWVNGSEPKNDLRPWLEERNAIWVEKQDFDETMLLIRDAFDLPHPDPINIDIIFELYSSIYEKLANRIHSTPADETNELFKKAIDRADNALTGWPAIITEAKLFSRTDPDKSERIYKEGLDIYPLSSYLLNSYSIFLMHTRKDFENAEKILLEAIKVDPNNTGLLLAIGKTDKGYKLLENEIARLPQLGFPSLAIELWFYAFCHWPENTRCDALKK